VELSIVSRETVITYAQLGGDERVGLSSFEARPDASDLSPSSAGRERVLNRNLQPPTSFS
jgi:hypothetical protein